MNGIHLFEGMSYVDERYIDEAETKAFPRKYWTNAAALAACLCLILLGLYQPLSTAVTEGAPETTMACAANPGDVQITTIHLLKVWQISTLRLTALFGLVALVIRALWHLVRF